MVMSSEDMSFGDYKFAPASHVPDMSRHVAEYLADMSVRSWVCQRPGRGADVDMSADTDMSLITLMGQPNVVSDSNADPVPRDQRSSLIVL